MEVVRENMRKDTASGGDLYELRDAEVVRALFGDLSNSPDDQ